MPEIITPIHFPAVQWKQDEKTIIEESYVCAALAAASTNNVLRAAVTGAKIRIISVVVTADTAAWVTVVLEDTAGSPLLALNVSANNAAPGSIILPPHEFGWAQSGTGLGIRADVGAGSGVWITVGTVTFIAAV